jgi:Flp pilus assembly protein TadG/cytoskeletal protein CcmA (bactofilin family)
MGGMHRKSVEKKLQKALDQSGAVALIMAAVLVGLCGFVALALDIGHMISVKAELQKAADAGALSGASFLMPYVGAPSAPNWVSAQNKATQTALLNRADNQPLTDCQVQYGYWNLQTKTLQSAGIIPTTSNLPAVQVTITKAAGSNGGPIQLFFAPTIGVIPHILNAQAVAVPRQSGSSPFDYTIFSGSPSKTLSLNGSQIVKGSAHANDKISINGSSNISGAAEGVNGVSINGSSTIGSAVANTVQQISTNGSNTIGSQAGGAVNIAMPDYFQQMASTAATVYNQNKTFNGSVNINGSIYVNGNVTLNGSISSTGAILATGDITVNGSSSISGSNQVCIYSQNGNITINGSSFSGNQSSEIIYAPNGKVTINGSFNFHGRIIAKEVSINGSANINGSDYPVTTLPMTSKGALLVQ